MTAPDPLEFLDARGWPIVDRLLAAACREHVTLPGATVAWGTVLTKDQAFPAARVQRLPGGGINSDGYQDVARIEITTYGTTREESDALTARVRQLMADLSDDEYAGVGLDRISEDSGPGRIPDPNEDVRAVPTNWSVVVRQQRIP